MHKFKVWNMLIWYIYILQYDYPIGSANSSIMPHNYFFFVRDKNNENIVSWQIWSFYHGIVDCNPGAVH